MHLNWNRPCGKRNRAFGVTLAALLLVGCGGYFSNEWPNLAEGFADAAERDAALEEAASDQEAAPEPAPVSASQSATELKAPPFEAALPTLQLSPEEILRIAADIEAASDAIDAAQADYEGARTAFLEGGENEDAARGLWLTAQLKLTSLSRAARELDSVLAELPLAEACLGAGDSETCALARRVGDMVADLAGYLVKERVFLTAQDPARSH